MRVQRPASWVLLVALAVAAHANPPQEQTAEALPPIFAQSPPPDAAKSAEAPRTPSPSTSPRARALSPEMASKIAFFVKSDAATRGPGIAAPAQAPGDSSQAIALERYELWEGRLPAFKEREILTDKGKLALARRRYPGADGASALALLRADFDAERRAELADYKTLLKVGGADLSPDMKRLIDGTIIPPTGPPAGIPLRSLLQK